MKKLFFLLSFTATTACCFSQTPDNTAPLKKDYLQKSKNQRSAAWFLLGCGSAINIVGIIVAPTQAGLFLTPSEKRREKTAIWLFAAGTATMLSSIPFFISGHVNKKKAMHLTIDTQQLRQLRNSNLYAINYPALTMKIRLR